MPAAERNRLAARLAAVPTASGGIVMAIGIVGLAALPHARLSSALLQQGLGVLLLALWALFVAAFAAAWREGGFARHTRPPVGRFAIGTWIAATAVLCRFVTLRFPDWRWLSALLGEIAVFLWLWFLPAMLSGFRMIAGTANRLKASGLILLSTVGTQSLALVLLTLFPERKLVFLLVLALVVLGYAFYGLAATLVVERYLRDRQWRLAEDWDNSNCILHGAMSISGLAAVLSGVFPPVVPLGTWLYAAAAFLLVEAIEVARLWRRLQLHGLRRGLLVYDVSQWSRVFTFGMFYAFTLAFGERLPSAAPPPVHAVQHAVLFFGQYVVLAALLAQLGVFAAASLHKRLS